MCGRYAASADPDLLVEEYDIDVVTGEIPGPDWNVAPTVPVPAVLQRVDKESGESLRRLTALRWGLVPSWSKDPRGGARMINARAETVAEKPSFRKAFAARRCLLPADGYYEWYAPTEPGARKQPFFIHRSDGGRLSMAGIYEFWRDDTKPSEDADAWLISCAVITTRATDALGHIHDRMPMVIAEADRDRWLDPTCTDPAAATELMSVVPPDDLTAYAVVPLVSSVRNNGPELLTPLDEA